MKTIRDLNTPPHIAGRVEAIVVRGDPRLPARFIDATRALAGIGLADDRLGRRGEAELSTRQVTLIQHEHLPLIAAWCGLSHVDPRGLRRNLVVSGVNLIAGHALFADLALVWRVGQEVRIEITGACAPFSACVGLRLRSSRGGSRFRAATCITSCAEIGGSPRGASSN